MSHLFTQIWQGGSKENYSILQRNWVTFPKSPTELSEVFSFVSPTYFLSPCSPPFFSRPPCPLLLLSLATHFYFSQLPSWVLLPHIWGSVSSSFFPSFTTLLPSFYFFSTFSKLLPSFWVLAKRLDELRTWLWKSMLSLKPEIHVIWSLNYLNFPHSSPATVKKLCHLVPFLM